MFSVFLFEFSRIFFPVSLLSLVIEINSTELIVEISDSSVVHISVGSLLLQRLGVVETFFVSLSVRFHLRLWSALFFVFSFRICPPSLIYPISGYLSLALYSGLQSVIVTLLCKPSLYFANFDGIEIVFIDDLCPVLVRRIECIKRLEVSGFENLDCCNVRGIFGPLRSQISTKCFRLERCSLSRETETMIV